MESKGHIRIVPPFNSGKRDGTPSFRGPHSKIFKKLHLVKSTWICLSGLNTLCWHSTTEDSLSTLLTDTSQVPGKCFSTFFAIVLKTKCSGVQAPVSNPIKAVGCLLSPLEANTALDYRRA